ncbi:hypothetical protein K1719_009316 [Acacia pycnantha]|nr:hypothetical protein K1719_009316 [Acacia pycnantha]
MARLTITTEAGGIDGVAFSGAFSFLVSSVSKIAQNTRNAEPNSVALSQIGSVKGLSLQSIVNVLKSLIDWEKSHRESEEFKKIKD